MTRTAPAVLAAIVLVAAAPARAQSGEPGRIELAIGPAWIGSASMTTIAATEAQADGTARQVFSVAPAMTSAWGVEGRVGVRVTRRLDVEAAGSYARPRLQLATSADVESAPNVTASEQLQQYTIAGAVVWSLTPARDAARTIPFVTAGAGYIRQLHETGTLADGGRLFDAGGGIKRLLASPSGRLVKGVGVRADVRARVRPKALAVDGRAHVSPMIAASLFVRF